MKSWVLKLLGVIVVWSSLQTTYANEITQSSIMLSKDIEWGYLNPLRGDKSPAATDLWGDRTKNTATGMLVKFNKGFASPPHIHNISYRGIVIEGLMHNDDPSELESAVSMPAGSYFSSKGDFSHNIKTLENSTLYIRTNNAITIDFQQSLHDGK
jgi:hypothetical protein